MSYQVILIPHQHIRFGLGLLCLGKMKVHLITVKVSIVRSADTFVEPKGPPLQDLGLVTHDRDAMEAGLSVEQHDVAVQHVTLHLKG